MKTSTKTLTIALGIMLAFAGKTFSQVASFTWSPNSPCPGQTVQLTSTSTGTALVTSYVYSLSGATTATVLGQNPVVTFTASGSQTVVLALFVGLNPVSSATNFITVKVPPTLTVASSQTAAACPNTSATLTATGNGTAWAWVSPLTSTLATASITVPAMNTTYSVVVTGTNGCTSTGTVVQNVTANPINITSSSNSICVNQSATLTAAGGTAYTWVAPLTSTAPAAVITPTAVGNISYSVNATSSVCPGYTWSASFTETVAACTGIQQIASSNVSFGVYPNPTSGEFTIELNNGAVKTVNVLDLTGRVVFATTTSNDKINVNAGSLAKGIYYVRVQSNNATEVAKIVVQ